MFAKKVDSIADAVRLVGIRGIKNLLYSYGTQKILGDDTEHKRVLWHHSYRAAFFAYNLVKNFHRDRNFLDDAYVGGILHDMGKIIFSNVHPELLQKIRDFCSEKGLPLSTFEDLAAGLNHAEIGAMVAEKWNFPTGLVRAIRFHHDPTAAPEEDKDLVEAVYMANMLCEYESGNIAFEQFEPSILENFGFTAKTQVDSLVERFSREIKQKKL
jgi:putative nucleotidyltransferase with HDIG domain